MSDSEEIQRQRIMSSIAIIECAKLVSLNAGVSVNKYEWDHNQEIVDRDVHNLRIYVGEEHIDVPVSDEGLMDFQGRVGTEKTERAIVEAVLSLLPESNQDQL